MTEPCRVLGVLDSGVAGLTPAALAHLRAADVAIGGTRTLELFSADLAATATRHDLTGRLTQVPAWIEQARATGRKVVVLATGDPLCHGIGKYLIAKLGADACEVLPNVSTMQLACARLKLPWQDAHLCSVHSQDAGEWSAGAGPTHGLYRLLQAIQQHDLLAVYTSPDNTPDRIARMLVAEGLADEFEMTVAECLHRTEEKIVGPLGTAEAATRTFADPNVIILRRTAAHRLDVLFGLPDDAFQQRKPDKGLITKREVRAVSLARLQLRPDSIVWDIGAGSGAVGLEAARLCPDGHVYAIEKNVDDVAIAGKNRKLLRITNYSLAHGKAPAGLDTWLNPDAVFIGGSGGELAEIIHLCLERLNQNGWLVMNFVTLENQADALTALKACGAKWDVTQIQAARSQPILHMHRLAAENPVWIVCAQKGAL